MEEELVVLYTNLAEAKNVMNNLKNNGISKAYLNTTEFGLHIGISSKEIMRKFPGSFPSTLVKLVVTIDPASRDNTLLLLENSFGVIDK